MEKLETTDLEKLEVNISILEEEIANKENGSNIMGSHIHAIQWLINELSKYKINFLKDKLFQQELLLFI